MLAIQSAVNDHVKNYLQTLYYATVIELVHTALVTHLLQTEHKRPAISSCTAPRIRDNLNPLQIIPSRYFKRTRT